MNDGENIKDYHAFEKLKQQHPHMIALDEYTTPFQRNKLIQRLLIDGCKLSEFQPKYKFCSKDDIPEMFNGPFVIKPLASFAGHGIHMTDDITTTLETSSYWQDPKNRLVLIEELIESEPVVINNKIYDPTYRAFVLIYSNPNVGIQAKVCSSFYKLPKYPLDTNTSLRDKHISWDAPQAIKMPIENQEKIEKQIEEISTCLFHAMLQLYPQIL